MRCIVLTILLGLLAVAPARGDGGTLRISQKIDNRQISVFTSPTPPYAGLVDVSVLVQDAATSRVLLDVPVRVRARNGSMKTLETPATREAATNKLMEAALLDLPQPGMWSIEVFVADQQEPLQFELTVEEPPPAWRELILWICWPFAAIALFVLLHWRNWGDTP